jgi:Ankyrin repeats (many copies)
VFYRPGLAFKRICFIFVRALRILQLLTVLTIPAVSPSFCNLLNCLRQACRHGRTKHVEHLLYFGANINALNKTGNTPLHVCALNNQVSYNLFICNYLVFVFKVTIQNLRLLFLRNKRPKVIKKGNTFGLMLAITA